MFYWKGKTENQITLAEELLSSISIKVVYKNRRLKLFVRIGD